MDIFAVIGLTLGILAVFGGALMEGLKLEALLQLTAFVIVIGGTLGATLLSFPPKALMDAAGAIPLVFGSAPERPREIVELLVRLALKARKEGILALQADIRDIPDDFLRKGLEFMTDGTDPQLLREMLETELAMFEEDAMLSAKVWESAGGYSPTIGIIGAVLGLIHVMENLTDPAKLGAGIAVAFVATVYGVGAANLVLIPVGSKIKYKRRASIIAREMMIEGILSIQAGESPNFIREKLKVFLTEEDKEGLSTEA